MGVVAYLYLASLVVGFLLALVTVIAGDFGGDHDISLDHDVDLGLDVDHDISIDADTDVDFDHGDLGAGATVSPLSMPIIASFLTFFGGTGLVADQGMHMPPLMSVPVASFVGIGVAAVAFVGLAKLFIATQGTAHGRIGEMVGLEAEVITPIAADTIGEIAFNFKGSRRTQGARSENGEDIAKHAMVKISRVVAGTCYVRPLVDERLRELRE